MVAVRIAPERVSVEADTGSLAGEQIMLGGVPRGAALVVSASDRHDTAGVQNDLAEHGYESLVLRVSGSLLDPAFMEGVDQVGAGLKRLGLRDWSEEQIGLIAYGAAGWIALHAAIHHELGAAVTVSPVEEDGLGDDEAAVVLDAAPRLRSPWLGLVAGSGRDVRVLDEALEGLPASPTGGAYARVVSYSGVPQDFYERDDNTLAHAAGFDAWQRTAEWLNQRVVPRPTPLDLLWRSNQ